MTGAESLLRTLAANGIDTCFMNPGTSEMHFVAALDRVPEVRGVLCLFEGVCSGAADGYGRMRGRPAATLLHLGPGLANALSNLHNARKARTPVVNVVGEHSTSHLRYDAPLSADIEAFARPVSAFVRVAKDASDVGAAAAETICAAIKPPGQVATLIVPADLSWSPAAESGGVIAKFAPAPPPVERIREAARLVRDPGTALLLGGAATTERALQAAGRLAAHTGVRIFADRNAPRTASGRGRFHPVTVPYFPEMALPLLADVQQLILVETQAPVSFFGYPNTPSYLLPESSQIVVLAEHGEDGAAALEAVADQLGAARNAAPQLPPDPPLACDAGPLTAKSIGAILAAHLPENAIVSDEMVSASLAVNQFLIHAAPHDRLPVTGGSIGQGLPVALGAACACPNRKVVALEADGSGMYTLQALWTMARENLDVITVIFANRRYQILHIEMRRTGAEDVGKAATDVIDIGRPALDWVQLAAGMGVPATRASTGAEFEKQFRIAMEERGPHLIEALI
jgi:acetolactate synthase I/II/III large subunit